MTAPPTSHRKYTMKISRLTIDKLGIHMYDRVSAVIAELIANSYDADATNVTVTLPFGKYLAKQKAGQTIDLEHEITIEDDGIGMLSYEVNDFYLKVGANRRADRGEKTASGRLVLGRKGIGKLAPFGICREIRVISAGGTPDDAGEYDVSDLILQYDSILSDDDDDYHPTLGPLDGKKQSRRGTKIILRKFNRKRVPSSDALHRQISARFGISRNDWRVRVEDSGNTSRSGHGFDVGDLEIPLMDDTRICVDHRPVPVKVRDEDDTERIAEQLPVTGWVAYSKEPYKDQAMAGVRVFARGKLVDQTRDFDIAAGFTGEYKMRSYVVGEIHADWLDDADDLIRSDRQGIIWSSERGEALQQWGVSLLKELARGSETSIRNRVWEEFQDRSGLQERLQRAHPSDPNLREAIERAAKTLVRSIDRERLRDPEFVARAREFAFAVGPHHRLIQTLGEVADLSTGTLEPVIDLFEKARVVEMYSLGQVARERIDALETLQTLIGSAATDESQLQRLIERAPWLLYPEWTPLTQNRSLNSLRAAFQTWYNRTFGEDIVTTSLDSARRPDFVMLSHAGSVEIVEIKRPGHALDDDEYDRAFGYYYRISEFLQQNRELHQLFPSVRLTIVCDKHTLRPALADSMKSHQDVSRKTWDTVLHDTMEAHQDFLSRVHVLQGQPPTPVAQDKSEETDERT